MTGEDKGSMEDEEASASRSSRRSKSESQISRPKSEHSEHGAAEQAKDAVADVVPGVKKASSKNVSGRNTPLRVSG